MLNDERNVFAIYVSYYVKVKLVMSGIGGEVFLKLPFALVHIYDELYTELDADPDEAAGTSSAAPPTDSNQILFDNLLLEPPKNRTTLASQDEGAITKRKLVRSSTIIKDSSDEDTEVPTLIPVRKTKALGKSVSSDSEADIHNSSVAGASGGNQFTYVQIHNYSNSNLNEPRKKEDVMDEEDEEGEAFGFQEVKEEKDDDNENSKYS